ncbi:MAG: dienelactone hydrolase family protein [Pseudomonadota bacterium]
MGEFTQLMARDGHEFDAWLAAPPPGPPRGALVILQEIFGVNSHIRAVADGFAAEGYVTIAPSLFDRAKRGVSLGYTPEDVAVGRGLVLQLDIKQVLLDITACINVVRHAGPVAAVGYCWGGTLAHLVACELPVAAAVAYYGSRIVDNLDKRKHAPVQYHFGARDQSIPPEAIEKIRAADPTGEIYVYPADHGFNCDQRAAFDAPSAKLARQRTLQFLAASFTSD